MLKTTKTIILSLYCMLIAATFIGCSGSSNSNNLETTADQNILENSDSTIGQDDTEEPTSSEAIVTIKPEEEKIMDQLKQSSKLLEEKLGSTFSNITLSDTLKSFGYKNPVMTQRLGADPYAIVFEGRVYLYMTGDLLEYDGEGKVKNNTYSKIHTLNVISSDDLVNWTDHGAINAAGSTGAATWGNNSWAPAIAHKKIDGKDMFFVYFANGGNGIGVLSSDNPTGPFIDPLNHALISRSTPNCSDVTWLFDPAVFVDDDGRAYLYFGGGIPGEEYANPGTGRIVELGDDMISIKGTPIKNDVPYLFEDSGINKIGNTYYYTYCSNWNIDPKDVATLGFDNAEILYMTSDKPMGPFTFQGSILRNPGKFFGCYGNNHHCMFEFNNQMYMAYHTQILEGKMGIPGGGYRATHIDPVKVREDGSIAPITATEMGVKQVKSLDPYKRTEAETMGTMGGIVTTLFDEKNQNIGTGNMVVTDIKTGAWIGLYGADFGEAGATSFTVSVKPPKGQAGALQIRLDNPNGEVVGYVELETSETEEYQEVTSELLTTVKGEHNLVFVFYGEGYSLDYWKFNK